MIYGERIRLRRNERSDIPKFVEWLNDPQVRRYLLVDLPISQANEEQWFEKMVKLPANERTWSDSPIRGLEVPPACAKHLGNSLISSSRSAA